MVGFPNKPMGFPTKNDQNLGCEMGGYPYFWKHPYSFALLIGPIETTRESFQGTVHGARS